MIRLINLKKSYDKVEVLSGITYDFNPGTITAIVGPNGSGKTTLIKAILGLVKPNSGIINIDGTNVNGEHNYRKKIGYIPQTAHFPENLSIGDVVEMIKDLHGSKQVSHTELAQDLNLLKDFGKPFKNLSGGTKQKVSVLIALLFDPEILILDEPTSGLDPVSSSYLKDLIIREKEKGKTIILTSHVMADIEELSTEIVFLLDGKVRFIGSTEVLKSKKGGRTLERAIADLMCEDDI